MAASALKPVRQRRERVENAAMRRRQLIEATVEAVVTRGLAATTLAVVADEAGLSQGVAVFYFKTKEGLLTETLRYHYEEYDAVWRRALAEAGDDPLDRLLSLVLADLDDGLCTARNLALWSAYWGEVKARPAFAKICDDFDSERTQVLVKLCEPVAGMIGSTDWTALKLAETLDALTDGFWARMHITPDELDNAAARDIVARFMVTLLPSHRDQILACVRMASGKKKARKKR